MLASDGLFESVPVLVTGYARYLPLLNLWLVLALVVNLVNYRAGRWSATTRRASLFSRSAGHWRAGPLPNRQSDH